MRAADFTIYARDAALERVGLIEEFSKLTMNLRFNALDAYVLDLAAPSKESGFLGADGAGIIVDLHGEPLLSGPVYHRDRSKSQTASTLIVSGPDDSTVISNRLAYPCPPPFTASEFDTRTGAAESVIYGYVDANAGPGAIPTRRVPGLTLAGDLGRGGLVSYNARFDPLEPLITNIALLGGDLGWRVLQQGEGLVFSVYVPVDRSGLGQFSVDIGNLSAFDYKQDVAKANHVVAGGAGTGTARLFVEADDLASQAAWGRIEAFKNDTSATTHEVLGGDAATELAALAEVTSLSMTPVDLDGLSFGKDYFLGDLVASVIDGVLFANVIREVAITIDGQKTVTCVPLVGTPKSTTVNTMIRNLVIQSARVNTLERT